MSNRSIRFATLACAAVALACVSARPASAQQTSPDTVKEQQKAAPAKCTTCKVEVENRYDYQALVFDKRETSRADVGTLTPLARVGAKASTVVQTRGRPNTGMVVHEDTGVPPTARGLKNCRQEAVRPETNVDFRFVCGN